MDSDTHVVPFVGFSYINCIYFAWFSTAPCKPVFSAAVKIGFYKTINLKIAWLLWCRCAKCTFLLMLKHCFQRFHCKQKVEYWEQKILRVEAKWWMCDMKWMSALTQIVVPNVASGPGSGVWSWLTVQVPGDQWRGGGGETLLAAITVPPPAQPPASNTTHVCVQCVLCRYCVDTV